MSEFVTRAGRSRFWKVLAWKLLIRWGGILFFFLFEWKGFALSRLLTVVFLLLLIAQSTFGEVVCSALFDPQRRWSARLVQWQAGIRFLFLDVNATDAHMQAVASAIERAKMFANGIPLPSHTTVMFSPYSEGLHGYGAIAINVRLQKIQDTAIHEFGHALARAFLGQKWPGIRVMDQALAKSLLPFHFANRGNFFEDRKDEISAHIELFERLMPNYSRLPFLRLRFQKLLESENAASEKADQYAEKILDFSKFEFEDLIGHASALYQELISDLLVELNSENTRDVVAKTYNIPKRGFYNSHEFLGHDHGNDHEITHSSRLFIGRLLTRYPYLKPHIMYITLTAMVNELSARFADPKNPLIVDGDSINQRFTIEIEKVAQQFIKH